MHQELRLEGKNNMETNHQNLKKGLLPRHVQFIALAGMIGTGIFKGSSDTLNIAGPSVVFAYLLSKLKRSASCL